MLHNMIVNIQEGTYGAEILVNDKKACKKLYPEMVIEQATLEEIMLFYINKMHSYGKNRVSGELETASAKSTASEQED